MANLIDADALLKDINDYPYGYRGMIKDTIAIQPTVDAVEVVRCKDCKHNYHNMIPGGEAEYGCTKCIELPITADFYCSWGERKEDADT